MLGLDIESCVTQARTHEWHHIHTITREMLHKSQRWIEQKKDIEGGKSSHFYWVTIATVCILLSAAVFFAVNFAFQRGRLLYF